MSDTSLEIIPTKASHGKTKLTVKLGGEVIEVEEFKVGQRQERQAFTKQLIEANPGLSDHADDIMEQLMEIASRDVESNHADRDDEPGPTADELLDEMPLSAKQEASEMLESPDLMDIIVRDVQALGVAGEERLIRCVYLIGVSRLLDKPLSCIIQGPTCTGKSYVGDMVAKLFPPETIIYATQMTPQALFHMKPGSLRNKFILAGERSRKENDDTAEATRALREMIGSHKLCKLMPAKMNGSIETIEIEQQGPIAYLESTTLTHIFDEDRNRCLQLSTDESSEQTARIVNAYAKRHGGNGSLTDTDAILLRHHALQRMLKPFPVSVPYAENLGDAFGSARVELRRAFPLLLSAIMTVTLLHQKQREQDSNCRLIASPEDYAIACNLFGDAVERSLGFILSPGARHFRERLFKRFGHSKWKSAEAVVGDFGKTAVYGWIHELHEHGDIEKVEDVSHTQGGKKAATWRFSDDIVERFSMDGDPDPPPMLPTPESLA